MNTVSVMVEIVLPVFGVVAIGYIAAKLKWMAESAIAGLSQFVFNIAIPVLLFRTMAQAELPEFSAWGYLISYYAGVFVVFTAAIVTGRGIFAFSLTESAIFGMCCGFSNTILIGIPLVLRAFGDQATLPLFLLIALHGVILFSATTIIAEVGLGHGQAFSKLPKTVVKRLFANPILIGLLAGLLFNLSGLTIPSPVDALAETLGDAAMPCATFAMGASISRFKLAGSLPHVGVSALLKLVIHPILVWILAAHVFNLPPLWTSVAVLLAALPCGVNAYLFAERYQVIVPTAASSVLVNTALSFVTVSIVLILLGAG